MQPPNLCPVFHRDHPSKRPPGGSTFREPQRSTFQEPTTAAVGAALSRFENRPIRDFIPLFVEKHASQHLAQLQAVPIATSA
ncbi:MULTISPECIES: three-helix bundle dimerization domain-containing protein [Mycobacteriaceae]|uniref:three-helix bundle dimerization domain-containing protein n=1 Tax=Mycobacteriaceae TaxID=1762 RepID=UPI0038CC02CB